jgi:hypothetical protein
MIKACLLPKCMHTLLFRGGVGQEMKFEYIKNWKYIGFSIKCIPTWSGYATSCAHVMCGNAFNANSSEPPRNLLQGFTPNCSKPWTTLPLPRFKKTVNLTFSLCTPRRCMTGEGVKLRSFWTSTLHRGSTSRPLYPRYREECVVSSIKPAWIKKNLLSYRKSDHKPSGVSLARSPVTMPTELTWLIWR